MFYVSLKVMFIWNLSIKDILNQTVHFFVCKKFIYFYLNSYNAILVSKVDYVFPFHNCLICYLIASSPAWMPREMNIGCMIILVLVIICNAPGIHTRGCRDATLFALLLTCMIIYMYYSTIQ